jgi:hypothetical protein
MRIIRWLTPHWTWTRKCRGCKDLTPHTHHLTILGHLHFRTFGGANA